MNRQRSSRLRQRLLEAGKEYQRLIHEVIQERGPLIHGSFGTRYRVCGNPNCRCARGEKHASKYLTAADGGRVRQVHVPVSDELDVERGVESYRGVRGERGRLAELGKQVLEMIDELCLSLLRPYPPEKPLPAPRRRGTKSKDGDGAERGEGN